MDQFDVQQAVEQYRDFVENDTYGSVTVDLSNVDFDALQLAIVDEFNCGAKGSIFYVLMDLNDTIGLAEFGFVWKEQ